MASYMDKKDHRTRNIFLGACALAAIVGALIGMLESHLSTQKSSATATTEAQTQSTAEVDEDVANYDGGTDSGGIAFGSYFEILKANKKYIATSEQDLKVLAFERLKSECNSSMANLAASKVFIEPRHVFDGHTPLRNLLNADVEESTRIGGYKKYSDFLDVLNVETCFSYLELGGPAYAGSLDAFLRSQGMRPNGTYLIVFQINGGAMRGMQIKVKGRYLLHKETYLREYIPEDGVILVR